jgi:hypothetical protein
LPSPRTPRAQERAQLGEVDAQQVRRVQHRRAMPPKKVDQPMRRRDIGARRMRRTSPLQQQVIAPSRRQRRRRMARKLAS